MMSRAPLTVTARTADDPGSTEIMVRAEGVVASYGQEPVVRDATFSVGRGETIALLGPSGCGKTTLLRTIAGLTPIEAGRIDVAGQCVSGPGVNMAPERRQVGMVFQDGALFPHLTVGDNVMFGLRGQEGARERMGEVLGMTGLGALVDRLPGTLSGGQQQRVALARALAPKPRVLLLDEPFSALDAGLRVELRREVRDILHEVGISAILVTHDQDEALSVSDRVGVMQEGRILQLGTPTELYEKPVSAWVASFVGEGNELTGPFHRGKISTVLGELPVALDVPEGTNIRAVVRPEQLEIIPGSSSSVVGIEYFGHDARYDVRRGSTELAVRTARASFAVDDLVDVKFVGGLVAAWPAQT